MGQAAGRQKMRAEDRRGFLFLFLVGWFFAYAQLVSFPGQFKSTPPTSVTFAKCLTDPGNHRGDSGGCRSQMQQANIIYFPRSQTQHRRQEEKKDKLVLQHFFLLALNFAILQATRVEGFQK